MQTSTDISQYLGEDQSIFRPIKREDESGGDAGPDRLSHIAGRRKAKEDPGLDIPENTRLMRSLVAGLIIGVAMALLQFVLGQFLEVKELPTKLYVLPLGRTGSFFTALKYGIGSGLVFGLGLGAILTKLKQGPFLGAIFGALVASGFGNWPWGQIAGVLVGILAGRFATVGIRRVVSV
jgi:hypothetical protein